MVKWEREINIATRSILFSKNVYIYQFVIHVPTHFWWHGLTFFSDYIFFSLFKRIVQWWVLKNESAKMLTTSRRGPMSKQYLISFWRTMLKKSLNLKSFFFFLQNMKSNRIETKNNLLDIYLPLIKVLSGLQIDLNNRDHSHN